MNERQSFYRKIAYGVVIALLLYPLSMLSAPETLDDAGGKLAQLRNENRLSQANLGEIDPSSEVMKLMTFGLRGLAANLLWEKANHYKKTEDWTSLTATLEQLAKLQPNFITFWKFQAWNLSYNVSVEFDDYHDRYYYVRRGIEFLKKGERYNRDNPSLLWDLGWFIGQKIGRADEHVQYRRLFKADDDYHPEERPLEQRDNWLVGKEWYEKGVDAVDNKGHSLGRKSPKIFYSSPPMSQINYSEAIEKEGFFEKARRAWVKASQEWQEFGQRTIEHSTGVVLRLGEQPRLEKEIAALQAKLDAKLPNVRETLAEEKRTALTEEKRQAHDTPENDRSVTQRELVRQTQGKLQVSDTEVAERIARENPEQSKEALQLASALSRERQRLRFTVNYKRDSNFDYWQTKCDFEQTPNALGARELLFRAKKAFRDDADLITAKKLYEEGFSKWRLVFDEFPLLLDEATTTGDDLILVMKGYRRVLDQLDESLDDDFPLWDIVEIFDTERVFEEELHEHKQRQQAL